MVSVVQGFVPLRKRIWGYQGSNVSLLQTAAAGARVMPYRGPLVINPNWTFEDTDQGDLVGVQAPSMRRWDVTASPSGPTAYDDLPWLFTPSIHGGVTPTGGVAKTWTFQLNSQTPSATPLGYLIEQWGDDVLTDWHQGIGMIIEELTLTGDVGQGPLQTSFNSRFAKALGTGYTDYQESGTVPNTALTIDDTPAWVYLDDCELFIDDTAGGIGVTKITDALETLRLVVRNIIDIKSPANGSNTRFTTQAFGRARVELELALTFAKTSQTVGEGSEADDWLSSSPNKRFVELRFTSPEIITGTTPYSLNIRMPGWYTTREDGENGNNTRVTLTKQGKYDATLGYPIKAVVVCATTALA